MKQAKSHYGHRHPSVRLYRFNSAGRNQVTWLFGMRAGVGVRRAVLLQARHHPAHAGEPDHLAMSNIFRVMLSIISHSQS